jgi:hypothetical protein
VRFIDASFGRRGGHGGQMSTGLQHGNEIVQQGRHFERVEQDRLH